MNEVANPWVVRPQKQFVELPPGIYMTKYVKVEDMTVKPMDDKDDGLRWRWTWQVTTGPYAGQSATALTRRDIAIGTHAGRLIEGLLGKPLKDGDNVQALVDACVGQTYLVSVQAGPKGGKPSVQSVGKPPEM